MAHRIPGIPDQWESFGLCLLLHMLFPLLPIIFEYSSTKTISLKSITLAASMYSIAIGVSSRSKLFFGLTLAICVFFAWAFGAISDQSNVSGSFDILARGSIALVFIAHGIERYNIHVIDRTPFPPFIKRREGDDP